MIVIENKTKGTMEEKFDVDGFCKKLSKDEIKELRRKQVRDRIGARIANLRKLAGWSQEELSLRAGLQRTHISRIEQGKYAVTLEVIQAIAEAFDMTVDLIDKRLSDLAPLKTL